MSKVNFNPRYSPHLKLYAKFLYEGKWSVCPFILEEPFKSIPEMCNYKTIRHFLKPHIAGATQNE